jgi:hypothetical protein
LLKVKELQEDLIRLAKYKTKLLLQLEKFYDSSKYVYLNKQVKDIQAEIEGIKTEINKLNEKEN